MLWLFQVFALKAGLYGCQVWVTSSLTYDSSKITPTHVLHLGFLKRLLGVKKSTNTHCVLRETGQMLIFFCRFRSIIRFWNSLLYSNNPSTELLEVDFTLVPTPRETLAWLREPSQKRNKKESIWAVDTHPCQQKQQEQGLKIKLQTI